MRTLYDEDIDYLEVVEEGIPNYAVQATPALLLFLSESDRTVVGFALESATEHPSASRSRQCKPDLR
jgi:hypothetical protein